MTRLADPLRMPGTGEGPGESEPVRLEVRNHVAVLTLDRPGAFNALDPATADGLAAALLEKRRPVFEAGGPVSSPP